MNYLNTEDLQRLIAFTKELQKEEEERLRLFCAKGEKRLFVGRFLANSYHLYYNVKAWNKCVPQSELFSMGG